MEKRRDIFILKLIFIIREEMKRNVICFAFTAFFEQQTNKNERKIFEGFFKLLFCFLSTIKNPTIYY